ncbi:MAG TPA: xanthine dehydrogenase family protein subunit M [bacterium]|nr:xanthine dehydrogenase family protein subunit M [bacterium]
MIPAAFEYHRPSSVKDALKMLADLPDAKLLAGGHSLLPLMKFRLASPLHLIDLGRIDALRQIRAEGSTLVIGALATHWMVESSESVKQHVPLLAETARKVGDVQVRNAGTIGGSVAHADPAADYPAALLAADAKFVAEGPNGRRTLGVDGFFTGVFSTALDPQEILTEVRLPFQDARTGTAYLKFAHPASGFAVVGVAAALTINGGRTAQARIGITGVGPAAFRPKAVEELLTGKPLEARSVAEAANLAADGVDVNEDLFASSEYRAHLARVFTKRAVMQAGERAGARSS